ncbi:four helix bundle protein [Pendulispora brunnea]|uniref:Four helix bundle protein n=1 Tax=Pendulispora brunnea TaxID=2905690 RepID=A0ABZ2K3P0_9BACT
MNEDSLPRLDHENLDVYRLALDFLRLAFQLMSALPRGESELKAQLKTAAMSIPLNVAEGVGKPTVADRARFHAIARGSAMECAALIDVCLVAGYISEVDARQCKHLLVRIVAMLTKMCR